MHYIADILSHLNDYLQAGQFQDYCPNGLQVEGKQNVSRVATAVSASENILKQAAEKKVDLLIVHHGMFWNKDPYVIFGPKKRKLKILMDHHISLAAYHLPLDAHHEVGNNWKAAIDLGWTDLLPFEEIGVRGRFKKQSREELQSSLESYYGQKAVVALGGKEQVETCALISGGAYRSIDCAVGAGVDCFVTGNFDEPAWHMAHEGNINFFALGHAATEKVGPRSLADYLRRVLNLDAFFLDELNPF
jgi:dinuclear metal center YbgI/SA1388 family protein